MNKENIRLLVDALRSGKYKQARNRLKKTDRQRHPMYCCLGVGCVLAGIKAVPDCTNGIGGKDWTFGYSKSFLPIAAQQFFGFMNADPRVTYAMHPEIDKAVRRAAKRAGRQYEELRNFVRLVDGSAALSKLNDTAKMSFKEIATVIEREFLSQ